MSYCPQCGASNKEGSKFCSNCSSPLFAPSTLRCVICGATSPAGSRFCPMCGARLETPPPAPAATTSARTPAPQSSTDKPESSEVAQPPSSEQPADAAAVPDWLARLRDASKAPAEKPHSDELEITGDDWLTKLRAAAHEQEPLTDETEPAETESEAPIPQWFTDVLPPATPSTTEPGVEASSSPLPEPQGSSEPPHDNEVLPDWLLELHSAPLDQLPRTGTSTNQDTKPTPQQKSEEDVPDWLAELQAPTTEDSAPSSLTARVAAAQPRKPEETSGETKTPDVANPPLAPSDTLADSPAAAESVPAAPSQAEQAAPGANQGEPLAAEKPPFDSTTQLSSTPSADSDAPVVDASAAASEPESAENEPDWLKQLRSKMADAPVSAVDRQVTEQAAELPQPAAEELPEWLRELTTAEPPSDETKATATEAAVEPHAEASTPSEPTTPVTPPPEWLTSDATPDMTEPEPSVSPAAEVSGGELPEWLREPASAAQDQELEALPDWLKDFGPEISAARAMLEPDSVTPLAETGPTAQATETPPTEPTTQASAEAQEVRSRMESVEPKPAAASVMTPPAQAPGTPATPEAEPEELPPPDWVRELVPPSESGTESLGLDASELDALPEWLREPGVRPSEKKPEAVPTPSFTEGLPGWIQDLKPTLEVTESTGALAGVIGVLPNAFATAEPHQLTPLPPASSNGGQVFGSVLAAPAVTPLTIGKAAAPRRTSPITNRLIYLVVLLAALGALFLPADLSGLGLAVNNTTPTAGFYDKIQALAPGSTVLLAFDYDPGQAIELDPAARVVVSDLAQRHINVIALSTLPAGGALAQQVLQTTAQQNPNWQPGKNFVNIGIVRGIGQPPGPEATLKSLAQNWLPAGQADFQGRPVLSQPLMAQVKGLADFPLVIELAGTDASLKLWMEQVQPQHQTTFVAIVSAAAEGSARNYLDAKQLAAFLRGLSGAAEYQLFLNQTGVSQPVGDVVRLVDAQSILHLVLFGIIILGNVVFLFSRLNKKTATPALKS